MKILYLCADLGVPVLGGKGASLHLRSLATALARRGEAVAVVAPTLVRSPWDPRVDFDVPVTRLAPSDGADGSARAVRTFREAVGVETGLGGELRRILYNEELRVALKRMLERTPPDLILERASVFGTAGSLVAAELGLPHVVELNAPLAVEQATYRSGALDELAAAAERLTLSRADAVLAVSAPLVAHAAAAGARLERVHVVPNGIDPVTFHPAARDEALRRRLGLGPGPLIGFIGGLRPWHGIEALPPLLERLRRSHPSVELVVTGEGPLERWLRAAIRERGLDRSAHVLGALPHTAVPALIRELDVALAPYPPPEHDFYFSPLKLFEYMGCGVALVASRVGQIAEVVQDGETGLLVLPGDPDDLAAACERLLGDTELRGRLGAAAAEVARRRHTWDANAARIVELGLSLREGRAVA